MKSRLKYLTLVAVIAPGAGVLGGARDALSSEKRLAATPSDGEEATEEESGPGAAVEEEDEGGYGAGRWGNKGKIGPSRWAKLSKDYRLCGRGTTQAPIDIAGFPGANACRSSSTTT